MQAGQHLRGSDYDLIDAAKGTCILLPWPTPSVSGCVKHPTLCISLRQYHLMPSVKAMARALPIVL